MDSKLPESVPGRFRGMSCGWGLVASIALAFLFVRHGAASVVVDGSAATELVRNGATYTISGTATGPLKVDCDCTIVLDNVSWTPEAKNANNKDLLEIADGRNVLLQLKGANTFGYGANKQYMTAIYAGGATVLTITNLTDDASLDIDMSINGNACIGGSYNHVDSGCGTINILGGRITAKSGNKGAGIGSYKGRGGTVNIYGGSVTATGGEHSAGIGAGGGDSDDKTDATNGVVNIYGGTVVATGGQYGAGIGGGYKGAGGIVNIYGGNVTASCSAKKSVNGAAGIGGGYYGDGGEINIYGGTVTVSNKCNAAAIGGGDHGNGASVNVYGGVVHACAGEHGAGIGGGSGGQSGAFRNFGGTVFATAGRKNSGKEYEADIGKGSTASTGAATKYSAFVLAGGSTRLAYGKSVDPFGMENPVSAETGEAANVVETVVENLVPGKNYGFAGLGEYGQNTLVADEDGKLYLWLPEGEYEFFDYEAEYIADVSASGVTVSRKEKDGSGADALTRLETICLSDGRTSIAATAGDFSCRDFGIRHPSSGSGDGKSTVSVLMFADIREDCVFADWLSGTDNAGKFKLFKSSTIEGLKSAETRETLDVSVELEDADAKLLMMTSRLYFNESEKAAFFAPAIEK